MSSVKATKKSAFSCEPCRRRKVSCCCCCCCCFPPAHACRQSGKPAGLVRSPLSSPPWGCVLVQRGSHREDGRKLGGGEKKERRVLLKRDAFIHHPSTSLPARPKARPQRQQLPPHPAFHSPPHARPSACRSALTIRRLRPGARSNAEANSPSATAVPPARTTASTSCEPHLESCPLPPPLVLEPASAKTPSLTLAPPFAHAPFSPSLQEPDLVLHAASGGANQGTRAAACQRCPLPPFGPLVLPLGHRRPRYPARPRRTGHIKKLSGPRSR